MAAGAESTGERQTGERAGERAAARPGGHLGVRTVSGRCGAASRPARRHVLRHRLRGADLPGVAEARRLLRDQLRHWGAGELSDTAELLTSELVTNALVHTGREALLTATLTEGPGCRLRVEVHDLAARRPRVRKPSEHSGSGRGLMLVEALADAWGVRPEGTGKTVWFELAGEEG